MLRESNVDIRVPISTQFSRETLLNWLRITILVVLDSLMVTLSWFIATQIGETTQALTLLWTDEQQPGLLLPILVINIGTLAASGLYGTDDPRRNFPSLLKSLNLAQVLILITGILYLPVTTLVSRSVFIWAWLLTVGSVFSERLLLHLSVKLVRSQLGILQASICLVGNPEDMGRAKQLLEQANQFDIRGTIDLSVRNNSQQWARTLEMLRSQKVNEVFICSWQSIKDPIVFFWELRSYGLRLRVVPVGLDLPRQWSEIKIIGRFTTIRFSSPPIIGSDFWLKRGFDLVASFSILVLISLPLLLIAIAIKLDSPGSIFYKQNRIGLKGKPFKVWKFRTMVSNADQLQKELEAKNEIKGGVLFKIKDDPRITRVGKFLRRYSLDELPQLINVLRGEMSLVGPRPLPSRDVERFEKHHFLRQEVLPGITGLWQVSGRSDVDSEGFFELDMAYIQHWSLALDCKILLQTLKAVLAKEGAY